jgi:glycosyltransferase involved in cell wall biosynthesis
VGALARQWFSAAGSGPIPAETLIRVVSAALVDSAWRAIGRAKLPAGPAVYLNVSHQNLDRPATIRRILAWARAPLVVMVHDLIPIMFPEYGRPGQADRHRRRIATVLRQAAGILANSAATRTALAEYLPDCTSPVLVAPLGVERGDTRVDPGDLRVLTGTSPYFVCLGTIEPRKNHLLLLHAWRRLVQEGGEIPHIYIVGRRGWENEMVVDLLERCAPIHPFVHEHNDLPDGSVRALLRGARALLMPSFAEGYGLPLAEAMAEGTPVLCSNIDVHREIGGDVAEYLDPLDGPAWMAAIRDYSPENSPRRIAQLDRLARWPVPRWETHMAAAIHFVDSIGSPHETEAEVVPAR